MSTLLFGLVTVKFIVYMGVSILITYVVSQILITWMLQDTYRGKRK